MQRHQVLCGSWGGEGPNRYGGLPVAGCGAPKYLFLLWSPGSGYRDNALQGDLLKSLI